MDSPFPSHVGFAAMHDSVLAYEQSHPEELAALGDRAMLRRRRSFSLGRIAAREAMVNLLPGPPPVLPGSDRAPCWPQGIVGSITHAADWALAAVDNTARTMALGLDLAWLPELRNLEIAQLVGDADERRWIDGDARRLLALFSAKESVYKALYPARRAYFGFEDVTSRWAERPTPGFEVRLLRPLSPRWATDACLRVGVHWWGDFVLTSVWLPAEK